MRWGRAARDGAVVGLAAVGVELAMMAYFTLQNRITPGLGLLMQALAVGAVLGGLLGLVAAPLGRLPGGRVWHAVAVAGGWAAAMAFTGPASAEFRRTLVIFSAIGLGLVLAGWLVARWRPRLAVAGGLAALVVVVAGPTVWLGITRETVRPPGAGRPAPAGAPDVVVVVLDTVRADHVTAYGYRRPTTPVLDALAREGVLFEDATAPSTWSLPSHASLFTGRFPSAHGAHDEHRVLDPGPPTIASTLAAAGWDTRCFTANAWISDNLGLTRGFAWQDEAWRTGDVGRGFAAPFRFLDWLGLGVADKGGAQVASNFEAWQASRPAGDRPAFAFLNFIEAHFPYHQVPDEYLRRFTQAPRSALRQTSLDLFAAQFGGGPVDAAAVREAATAMYDAGVAYADALLGRVVEAIRRRGALDRTVIVVLADHGELLGEDGEFGHGHALLEPVLRVPLVVRYPPRFAGGTRVATPVSTVGVFATVLDLAGVQATGRLDVGSLVPVAAGRAAAGPVIAERFANQVLRTAEADAAMPPLARAGERYRSYRSGAMKLIEAGRQRAAFLFDLATDPTEDRDLAGARPADLARLRGELETWRAALGLPALDAPVAGGAAPALDPAARERLKALGYVE